MRAEDYEPIVDKDLQIIEKLNFISLNSDKKCQSVYPISQIYQFQILLQKMMRQICRNKTVFYIQLFHYVICAITVGLVFYNVGNDGIEVFNHLKFCMGTILFLTYTQIMIPVLICTFNQCCDHNYFFQFFRIKIHNNSKQFEK